MQVAQSRCQSILASEPEHDIMIRAPFDLNESSLQSAVCICSDRTVLGPAANKIKPPGLHLSANYFCHSNSFVTYRSI